MADDILGNINSTNVTTAPQTVASAAPSDSSDIIGNVNSPNVQSESDRFGSIPQQLGTAAESAASTLTFGGSRYLEPLIGKALGTHELDPANQQAREAENPISSAVGGIGAFATGIGAAGAIGAAGSAGAAALGLGDGIAARSLAGAVKYGIEGALVQGGNETGKLLTNAPETAGTAAINIGLAGLIGGGIGGATGGLSSLWAARNGAKVASALDSAGEAINTGAPPASPTSPAPQTPEGVTGLATNAPEIQASADRLKVKLTPSALLSDEFPRTLEGNLAQRGSLAGVALQREANAAADTLRSTAQDTLSDATKQSQAQIGSQIKKNLSDTLLENLKPIEEGYKAAEGDLKKISVSDNLKIDAIDPIANHDFVKLDPEANSVAKRVSDQIQSIDNLSDLKKVRTLVSSQLNAEYGAGQGAGPKAQILQTAKDSLTKIRDNALLAARTNGEITPGALENIKSLDAQYAGFQNTVKQLGVEGGLGKSNTARSLLSRFNDLSDESFTKKVFDTGDVRNMQFFKQNFPESFDLARRYKLAEIADNSIDHTAGSNGRFSTSKYLTQVRKLGDEAQQNIFGPEDLQRIKDIQNVHEAIPIAPNSSKTSYSQAFANILSPSGVVQNLTDAAQYAYLKALPHLSEAADLAGGDAAAKLGALKFAANTEQGANPTAFKSMVDYIRATAKGQSSLNTGMSNLFDATKAVLPSHLIPDQDSRDKLQKQLDYASTPSNALNVGNSIGHYLPDHATAQGTIVAAASNYLGALKPKQPVMNPMDTPPAIDKAAQNKYNRALDVAQQPLLVLQHVKNGTLLPQDVQTLQTIYPALHSKMVQMATNEIIKANGDKAKIPYAQRSSLNMLMGGNPLDGTMNSSAMQSIIKSAGPQQQAQQQMPGRAHPASANALRQINKVNDLYKTPSERSAANKSR